jgi:hypothetical protein
MTMPKIDTRTHKDFAAVKGWATAHVVIAVGVAFAIGVFVGAVL